MCLKRPTASIRPIDAIDAWDGEGGAPAESAEEQATGGPSLGWIRRTGGAAVAIAEDVWGSVSRFRGFRFRA
jgi:hypothetical protein